MVIALVAFLVGAMNRHVHGHAITLGQLAGEVAGQLFAASLAQFGGQTHDPFAGGARILALFGGFGGVPQLGTVGGSAVRHQDFSRLDTRTAGVVVDQAGALIDQLTTRPISSSSNGRTSGASRYRFGGAVEDCHGS